MKYSGVTLLDTDGTCKSGGNSSTLQYASNVSALDNLDFFIVKKLGHWKQELILAKSGVEVKVIGSVLGMFCQVLLVLVMSCSRWQLAQFQQVLTVLQRLRDLLCSCR